MKQYLNLTQEQHEVCSTRFLWLFREKQQERVLIGEIDGESRCGAHSQMVESLLWCFFDAKRNEVGLRTPSPLMSVAELISYINDEALCKFAEYRPDLLEMDWQGDWQLLNQNEDDYSF